MKKQTDRSELRTKRLVLAKEQLRHLARAEIVHVIGGTGATGNCRSQDDYCRTM